jgi:exonuclease III
LLKQGIEKNSGPNIHKEKTNLSIRSYNCNGLWNQAKLKRVLTKVRDEVRNGGIVLLQETHIKDSSIIEMYWKMNFILSCVSTQSAGVLILYSSLYKCHESFKDTQGRFAYGVFENDLEKIIVENVYVPCDPTIAIEFMEGVYVKLYEVMDRHVDAFLIMGGDFNACMNLGVDSLNRNKSLSENRLTDFIKANNDTCGIVDSYRCKVKEGGYTWASGSCQSRLDYIFVSKYLSTRIKNVKTDWAFEQSDHASVKIEISIKEDIVIGPCLTKINSAILENPATLEKVKREILEMLMQIPEYWNPHEKLEFLKVTIRTVISMNVCQNKKELTNEMKDFEKVLNEMCELKTMTCLIENLEER